jgi:uncharacterized membrane protein YjgN (DUF898 family)
MEENNNQNTVEIPFEFTGTAGEYFRIWIINVVLTILTLGIYSAWAKVRKKRYFYGNTLLLGDHFEYLANPVAILRGRLLVLGIILMFTFGISIFPPLLLLILPLSVLLFPWIVMKAFAFKTRYSSYRNIRFNFAGTYSESFGIFFGLGILSYIFTLGLAYPYFVYRRNEFIFDNSSYGTSKFTLNAPAKKFYGIYIKTALLGLLLSIIALSFLFPLMLPFFGDHTPEEFETASSPVSDYFNTFYSGIVSLFIFVYIRTSTLNLVWSNTTIARSRFRSTLELKRMFWIYVSNILAILFSFGLLAPWASIRMTRYRLNNVALIAVDDFDTFVAGEQNRVSSAGEEISEFFDFDIGL